MKKLISLLCSSAMVLSVAPMTFAADTADVQTIMDVDFAEPQAVKTSKFVLCDALNKDFEGSDVVATPAFSGNYGPYSEKVVDGTNTYADINAGKYYQEGSGIMSDWVFGGYEFSKAIEEGNWTIDFDVNFLNEGYDGYSAISLINKTSEASNAYSGFHILGRKDGALAVNKTALDGTANEFGKWYHYQMKLDKTAGTYAVKITADGKSSEATGTLPSEAFEGLMVQAGAHIYMDNIKVQQVGELSKDFEGTDAVETKVFNGYFGPYAQKVTEGTNSYADINAGKYYHPSSGVCSDWVHGGYDLPKAITSGKWEIDFDVDFVEGYQGYACIALANKAAVSTAPYSGFQILGVNADQVLTVNKTALTGTANETGKWYHYNIVVDKDAGTYTVTLTADDKSSEATGTLPDTAFDGLMFSAGAHVYIDNIKVNQITLSQVSYPTSVAFNGSYGPVVTVENGYANFDAGRFWHSGGWYQADWVFGGYVLPETISQGTWNVDFKFKATAGYKGYSFLALANKADTQTSPYGQFKIVEFGDDGAIIVNGEALTGTLAPVKDNWYNFHMSLNKTKGTYTVTIDDGKDSATGSGTIAQTLGFDGFIAGAGMVSDIDDLKISKVLTPDYTGSLEITEAVSNDFALGFVATANISEFNPTAFGFEFIPQALLTNDKAEPVVATYDYTNVELEDGASFAAVLTGIPASFKDVAIAAKAFFVTGGEKVYSDTVSAKINDTTLTQVK